MNSIKPLNKRVLGKLLSFGARQTSSGIHLLDDDGKEQGIRPRWFQVAAIGPKQQDVEVGDYILVEHGRWSWAAEMRRKDDHKVVEKVRMIDEDAIIGKQTERPAELDFYENPD